MCFNENPGDGIAAILGPYYGGEYPTTNSEQDPDQGWGDSVTEGMDFEEKEYFHKVFS